MLKSLSLRGATVVVSTHTHDDGQFERVIHLREGAIDRIEDRRRTASLTPPSAPSKSAAAPPLRRARQWPTLVARELQILRGDWARRIALPQLLVPVLFAVALHLSVTVADLDLLGFLLVVSSIWMGASLGLLAIVDERKIVEHERRSYLRCGSYLFAKLFVLLMASALQTGIFFANISLLRWLTEYTGDMFFGWPWALVCLVLVGWTSVAMGLFISTIAGFSQTTANFALPLVMIAQIVFSVVVVGHRSGDVEKDYSEFTPLRTSAGDSDQDKPTPTWFASLASTFTVSRYGDMALRSFAYGKGAYEDSDKYRDWFWGGIGGLSIWGCVYVTCSWLTLQWRPLAYEDWGQA